MLLLDTTALLWIAGDRSDLGPQARKRIRHRSDAVYSPLSIAEIVMKEMAQRPQVRLGELRSLSEQHGINELPYRADAAQAIVRFPLLIGTDPFDRMLLAQAAAASADFLTADRRLLGLDLDWVIDARE